MDTIHRPVFISNSVSKTGLCLHPQVESVLCWAQSRELVPEIETSSICLVQLESFRKDGGTVHYTKCCFKDDG
jgi:hypothetical protein